MNKRKTALEKEILSNRPVITLTDGDSMEPLLFHHSSQIVIVKAKLPLKKVIYHFIKDQMDNLFYIELLKLKVMIIILEVIIVMLKKKYLVNGY